MAKTDAPGRLRSLPVTSRESLVAEVWYSSARRMCSQCVRLAASLRGYSPTTYPILRQYSLKPFYGLRSLTCKIAR